jgi:predicted dehydrogenase
MERIPSRVKLTAIAEPNTHRLNSLAERFGVAPEGLFADWCALLESDLPLDAVIVATPDHLHYLPSRMALERGLHLLLEKPIARTLAECEELARLADERGVVAGVCHVMRYFPAYVELRRRLREGQIGTLISINHREPIGIDRMTHAFVRGIWRREADSNPLILSKTSHDLDLLCWLVGQPCTRVASFGSLRWFRPENAPEGSTERCLDCPVEHTCRFSAVDLYLRRREWLRHFDATDDAGLRRELRTSPYGLCAFRAGNDVVDHQNVILEFADGVRASLTLDAFTADTSRTTHLMGSRGEIKCTEHELLFRDFQSGREERVDFTKLAGGHAYHYGSDNFLAEDFIAAIEQHRPMVASLQDSVESHRIAFRAEAFRKNGF